MKKIINLFLLITLTTMMLITASCGVNDEVQDKAENKAESKVEDKAGEKIEIIVSAAASLKDSMLEITELYKSEKPNVTVTWNFGSSGSLQQQIEQGAPVDIFISAAQKQMNALTEKELLLNDTVKDFLKNEVVLIAPKDSTATGFSDLTTEGVKKVAVGEPKSVPAGQYAKEVLDFLEITDKISDKSVYAKDVREVLTWVETGNADAGIVYKSDTLISDKIKIVENAPAGSHKEIIYPLGIVKVSKQVEASEELIEFLSSENSGKIFEKYGFEVVK